MSNSGLGKSSIVKKVVMALSGLFLIVFLLQHLVINLLSVINPEAFNTTSDFMGTNPVVQFVAQPILIAGILVHYLMGIILTIKNKKARPIGYIADNQSANSSWVSRNMIITGLMIFFFLILHMKQFWIHEISLKFFGDLSWGDVGKEILAGDKYPDYKFGGYRYWEEVRLKFADPINASIYTLAFIFLGLHLAHGFDSTFQSVGFRNGKYTPALAKAGKVYSVVVPLLFTLVVWIHFFKVPIGVSEQEVPQENKTEKVKAIESPILKKEEFIRIQVLNSNSSKEDSRKFKADNERLQKN